jgi:heme-degrading monooxygenase HmoA
VSEPALVTLHVWGVPGRAVPAALLRMAADRAPLRRQPGLLFGKLLGTGSGRTFTLRDADPRRWAVLAAWADEEAAAAFEHSPLARRWRRLAGEEWTARLRPLASRGRWSGAEPFGRPSPQRWDGPVAAVTRARLAPRSALSFWRAVPPVSADLHAGAGLRFALGIGEAPVGLQGTFSVWESAAALNEFAYGRAAHTAVIRRTAEEGWYAEELFARFAVLSARGTVAGRDPLAAAVGLAAGTEGPVPADEDGHDDRGEDATTWPDGAPGVLRLPSGRRVRGRSLRKPLPDGPVPDFALHLLGDRPPEVPWASIWVHWPDFRLPGDPAAARAALTEAWRRAETERVEVGCAGGRGRTGTALACLAVLDGVPPEEAVDFVRRHYDRHAVETPGQRRFVRSFG